jgi:hypothetical protein
MDRDFNIGDRIVCTSTGVVGKCLKFYVPTACAEQTMVLTDDGRRYHAPTSEWTLAAKIQPRGFEGEETKNMDILEVGDIQLNEFQKAFLCAVYEAHKKKGDIK